MARMRTIKPGFFTNDVLAEVEPLGRILFAGLWTLADRAGRLEDRPRKIKVEILPYDECDIESLLAQLAERRFITRYDVNGTHYIQIRAFDKHQCPNIKETPSTIPPPPDAEVRTVVASVEHDTSTMRAPSEHSTIRNSNRTEGEQYPPPPDAEDENPLMASLLEVCRLDFDGMSQRKRTELHETLEALRAYMPRPDDRARAPSVAEFGKYFAGLGFKDPKPSLSQVRDHWLRFEDWRKGKSAKAESRKVTKAPDSYVRARQ
jgi:hypothetical protein